MPYLGQPFIARVTTQFDVASSTTLANVTDLVVPATDGQGQFIQNGGIYLLEANLITTSNVAAGVKVAFGGTATATALQAQILIIDGAAAVPVTNARQTALGTGGGVTAVTVAWVLISGCIVVNAAGTLAVQFAQNASNAAASSVLTQSTFRVTRVDTFYQPVWQIPA